jgi:hypothetical protein
MARPLARWCHSPGALGDPLRVALLIPSRWVSVVAFHIENRTWRVSGFPDITLHWSRLYRSQAPWELLYPLLMVKLLVVQSSQFRLHFHIFQQDKDQGDLSVVAIAAPHEARRLDFAGTMCLGECKGESSKTHNHAMTDINATQLNC